MTERYFEWDPLKNLSNQRKHGVSFEEAAKVFDDDLHLSIQDRIEGNELRWQTYGRVDGYLLLMVAHTLLDEDEDGTVEIVRIISARPATRKERNWYENG